MAEVSPDTQERLARNEATFRRINEDIRRGRDPGDETLVGFVCECGAPDCTRLIEMTTAEYERVRSDPLLFAVVSGHEIDGIETVVDRNERYTVVRKMAASEPVALATDPRT
ncbi:MAG: hypothetical protein QOE28_125 [Solirubrobacteraceae bacterium]|jgi:hypothetical protein|nr:hypothetical protein [Solirubrobacteraceae bacterium]